MIEEIPKLLEYNQSRINEKFIDRSFQRNLNILMMHLRFQKTKKGSAAKGAYHLSLIPCGRGEKLN